MYLRKHIAMDLWIYDPWVWSSKTSIFSY